MESPQPQQISVSGHIAIEGQQPAPNSTSLENAPASPSQPWWRFWRKPPEIVLAIATVILAIVTIVLAIIAGIQAWILSTTDISTRRAADAAIKSASAAEIAVNNARENFRSEQRPIIWLADTTKFPSFPSFRSELGGRITWCRRKVEMSPVAQSRNDTPVGDGHDEHDLDCIPAVKVEQRI
jgi:MFS superfamily sulfate permease-like transporter